MDGIRHLVRNCLFRIGQIEMIFAAAVLVGIVLMISVQVLLSAGLGRPITWEQEAGAYALVWLTFHRSLHCLEANAPCGHCVFRRQTTVSPEEPCACHCLRTYPMDPLHLDG